MSQPGPTPPTDPALAGLSVDRMRALLDYSWDILSLLDGEGRLIYNSPAAQRIHGFSPAEMAAHSTFEFFHPEDVPKVEEVFRACLAQPGLPFRVQYRYARKDGSWVWMEAVAVNLLENPAIHAIVVNSRDITDRKVHEQELERVNRLYGMLSHVGQSLVRVQNREGLFQEICSIAVEKGGFRLAWIGLVESATGRVVPAAKAGPAAGYLDGISIWSDERPEGNGPTGICIREDRSYVCQDFSNDPATTPWQESARVFGLRASASVPIHFEGRVVGALMVYSGECGVFQAQDVALLEEASAQITFGLGHLASEEQRNLLEFELAQTQKLESLGSLAGGVAHDMNNVLGSILGMASLQEELQPRGTAAHDAFALITRACNRGGTLVRRLLDFARRDLSEVKVVDLNALLQDEVKLLERTTFSQIAFSLVLEEGLPCIQGDASALAHAVINLCINAVDAMPQGGRLTLTTRTGAPGWVEVEVRDTGIGMPKQVLEKATDPFFTTKPHGKGTGLGLSIVYSTVKAHHGTLELHSMPGRGTQVLLRFPCIEYKEPEPSASGAFQTGKGRRSLEVLLVDDDELLRGAVASMLGALGHRLVPTASGEEALARLEEGLDPQLVILDLNMPGLGGQGTLPRLRVLRPDLPVLLATGRVDQTALDLAHAFPKVLLLPKPFSLGDLAEHLDTLALGVLNPSPDS